MILGSMALAVFAFVGCGGDDGSNPGDPSGQIDFGDGVFADVSFNDFGADARRVLPPVYTAGKTMADSLWRDDAYPILGKVFSQDEPMSIYRNIDDHETTMQEIQQYMTTVAEHETENGELPSGPIPFQDEQYGSGTMTFHLAEPTEPIAVPAVCRNVLGLAEVPVDFVLQASIAMDGGMAYESPYFGFSTGGAVEVVYYWSVGYGEDGVADGSQLFYAAKDTTTRQIEVAGAYFKPDGPGDEERCNWVYHVTGDDTDTFTYNMGWYSENPQFQLFACVQGSGDKDSEFGLRFHQYTDSSGWDAYEPTMISEKIFGPVDGDPYAFIEEPSRSGTIADYVDESVMFVRDDSPLDEIPNPFAVLFVE